MLKKRVIAIVLVQNGLVVQSIGFREYLPVGNAEIAIEFLNDWGVDEIILLDITATRNSRDPDLSLIQRVAKHCLVPLTVGGGIHRLEQARDLIRSGADKVSFNHSTLTNKEVLFRTADVFGSQCVVASIDAVKTKSNYRVYDYLNHHATANTPAKFAADLANQGVGEILINSVDRDGSKLGFDLELVKSVCQTVNVPVICCGGAGKPEHFISAFKNTNVHAAAAANFFHFTEHSVTTTKSIMRPEVAIRHDTSANYNKSSFDEDGRLKKKSDQFLEDLLFERIEKEVI